MTRLEELTVGLVSLYLDHCQKVVVQVVRVAFHHHPELLQHSPSNLVDSGSAIVLRPVLDKDRICYLLAAVLLASPVSAAVVGWYTAKVEVGVALWAQE